ncbi:hypothetical protein ACLFMI_15120 [Pseudonocardia nantongensis]|uniref:hypothetical protein n=1 Tax=Pseudonocardia nantongensis TaxID=1181885 RepID=UPI00397CA027
MRLPIYLGMLHDAEQTLAESWRRVADGHAAEADVHHLGHQLAGQCDRHIQALRPLVAHYGEQPDDEPERLAAQGLSQVRSGPVGLLRDLQDLYLLASFVAITWDLVEQAGQAIRDPDLLAAVRSCREESTTQVAFLRTRLEQAAPQALASS